jgi:hypothetical protein
MVKNTTIIVLGKELPLNEFAERVSYNVVMALIKSLRSPTLKGTEQIRIEISQ